MAKINKDEILEILRQVKYPGFSRDIVSFGLVSDIKISGSDVEITLKTSSNQPEVISKIYQETHACLEQTKKFDQIKIGIDNTPPEKQMSASAGSNKIPGVKHVIAVASGKGGVGKSTVAVNLAAALSEHGRVGICDCDLYGPSLAIMLGGESQMPAGNENNQIIPITLQGLQVISMGFLLEDDSPVIVRGPLATRYTQQFLTQVAWDNLDYLIIDMPPGTGDIHLTVAQTIAISGAVIVTTPQEVALIDARKACSMFKKVNIEILGLVENMSYFICPDCNNSKKHYIFGKGGGKQEAKKMSLSFLGEIPIDINLRESGDIGIPNFFRENDKNATDDANTSSKSAFRKIAKNLVEKLN